MQVFLNTDLRMGHPGLSKLAIKNKLNPDTLADGEYILFINSKKNKLKLYAAKEIVAYLRLKTGVLDMRAISIIPRVFESRGRVDYDEAIREVLTKELARKA